MALVAVYQGDYTNDAGVSKRWQIAEDGGTFVANLTPSGRDFVTTTWSWSNGDEYSPLMPSSTALSLFDTSSNDLYGDLVALLDDAPEETYVMYLRDMSGGGEGAVEWRGYVKRATVSIHEEGVRVITVDAHDGLGLLDKKSFTSTSDSVFGPLNTIYTGRVNYTSLISTLLIKTNLGGDIYISSSRYPRLTGAALSGNGGAQLDAADNPWDNVYVDRHRYRVAGSREGQADRPVSVLSVLRDVLEKWGCILFQAGGDWHVIQVNLRGNNTLRRWRYNSAGTAVGSPNYADVTAHVIAPSDENYQRSPGRITQLPPYDAVQVSFEHGEYKFMPNPGFDFGGIGPTLVSPAGWTIVGTPGAKYENLGKGDGQLILRAIQLSSASDLPATTQGTGATSVDAFVGKHCNADGGFVGASTLYEIATFTSIMVTGTYIEVDIDAYEGNVVKSGTTIWFGLNGSPSGAQSVVLSQDLVPGDETIHFNSKSLTGVLNEAWAKNSGYAYSSSQYQIGGGEIIEIRAQYLTTLKGGRSGIHLNFGGNSTGTTAYFQVKLVGGSGTRYLYNAGGTTGYQWSSTVSWVAIRTSPHDWQSLTWRVLDPTPFQGVITVTAGPAADYSTSIGGGFFGSSGRNFAIDEIRWDNVDVFPVMSPLAPNRESTYTVAYSDSQTSEVTRIRTVSPMVGDAPISSTSSTGFLPVDFGTTLDDDGLIQTEDWEEAPIIGSESGLSHENIAAKSMLRSMRAPRIIHSATYFDLDALLTPWYILSRGGSEYAPKEVTINWNKAITEGSWYKVTESGFTDDSQVIYNNAALVSSRGGVGEAAAGFFSAMGNVLFADGSGAITRTTSVISAGAVTSIDVEPITEPIFKAGNLVAIIGPDLNYVQARISADQDALATTLAIEDKDTPATGVTFDADMGYPAAVYFLEAELLTLARLGEQGFAVTVVGENLGKVDGAQSGTLTSLDVKEWAVTMPSGAQVYLNGDVIVTLDAPAYRGTTSISFASTAVGSLADNQVIKPAGSVPRADFKITADAISSYIGAPGDVIATVASTVTFDGTNTSIPVGTSLTDALVAADPILIYTASGSVIKATVNAAVSAAASPIVLTAGDGNQSGNISAGDRIVAGSITGLRIDMAGIEITADSFASSNYAAGSAGWSILADGSAEFNDVSVRGSITLTASSSGLSNFTDAGALAFGDDLDDVGEGTNFKRWPVTGKPPTNTGATGSGLYVGLDSLGYWNGSTFTTYMDNGGNFYLTGASGYLTWTAATETLSIKGSIEVTGGSGLSAFTDAGLLAGLDTINGTHIDELSISTPKIAANAVTAGKIAAGTITATEIAAGTITANKINVSDLFAQTISLTGSISGTGWSITSTAITMESGSIDIGNFTVNTSGNLTATNVNITGAITATSGTFSGDLSAAGGSFSGDLTGASMSLSGNLIMAAGNQITAGGSATFGSALISGMTFSGYSITAVAGSPGPSISVDSSNYLYLNGDNGVDITTNSWVELTHNGSPVYTHDTFSFYLGFWGLWSENNDGPDSGLHADLLDNYHASDFLLASDGATFSFNETGHRDEPVTGIAQYRQRTISVIDGQVQTPGAWGSWIYINN